MGLTIVMAVYGQPKILAHQLDTMCRYDDKVLDKLTVIIVDDHGDPVVKVAEEHAAILNIQVWRILEDIPWNQMGARNIGMREAEGWCVMLDPDMVIEPNMIGHFMAKARKMRPGQVVKFGLKHSSGRLDYSSPNTWLIYKDDFFRAGGYDEDFRGHKGWSDCLLQETLRGFYPIKNDEELYVSFHLPGDGYEDAMVLTLNRSVKFNGELKRAKNKLIKKMGGFRRYINRGLKGPNFRCKAKRVH